MKILYSFGIRIYGLMIGIAAIANKKAKLLKDGQRNALKNIVLNADKNAKYVWFHAASLGEFEQGRPVVERLKMLQPDTQILLTFFSPSGYEVRKNYQGADIITYLPLDTARNARKLLSIINIEKAVFIKYEFWFNFLSQLKQHDIPTYCISAIFRSEQLFFKTYGKTYLNILKNFTHIFVQDENSRLLLEKFNVKNASVAGDTRFDRVADISKNVKQFPLIEHFTKNSFTIVAGSSWAKDEDLLIKYFENYPDVKLVIAPHEINEVHIAEIERKLGGKCSRYTQANEDNIFAHNCLIIDTIGMLSAIYQYGQIAYIGGGFGVGIHNTLEAAVWAVPVVFGANYQRFREANELIAVGGGFSINNYEELEQIFNVLKNNILAGKYAGDYVQQNVGATETICRKVMSNKFFL